MAARHHAAARGRGRDAAAAACPAASKTASERCSAFVAAVVRASEDPELALSALHVARRELSAVSSHEKDGPAARAGVELLDRAISALYLYDVCAGELPTPGQGRGAFSHAQLCALKAQLVLSRCLASRAPRLPALAMHQAGLGQLEAQLRDKVLWQKPAGKTRAARATPRDAKAAGRAPPAPAERTARLPGAARRPRRVVIVHAANRVRFPPALGAAQLPPAALHAVASAVARVCATACGADAAAVAGRRAARVQQLFSQAAEDDITDEQRTALAVRAKALQLAPVQARLRSQVERAAEGVQATALQRFQPPVAEDTAAQGDDDHDAVAVTMAAVLAAVQLQAAGRKQCAGKLAAAQRSRNAAVLQAHAAIAAAAEARRAQAQAERLAALKRQDYTSYMRLVRCDTTSRIRTLLSRTDAYLAALSRKLDALRASAGGAGGEAAELPATSMLRATLRPYQQAGVRWLVSLFRNGLNGCLADEMGLGKTVQVIALLCHLVEHENLSRGPFMIVVPASVLPNWASELARWAPQLDVATYTGPEAARSAVYAQKLARGRFQVCLTTFEYVMNAKDVPRLSRIKWAYLVMDEAHRIKNASCRLSRELEKYRFGRRLLLTGTPVQNNLGEMATLLQFLMPTVFNSDVEDFVALFDKPFEGDAKEGANAALNEEERLLVTTRLHEALRPFMLRRVKEKVATDLPLKREVLVRCAPSGYQAHLCRIVTEKAWASVATAATAGAPKQRAVSVNNVIMELRVLCNHPFLSRLHDTAEEEALGLHPTPSLVRHCGKLETLDRILSKLKLAGHRVLLFCTMTRLLDVMEEYLGSRGFKYLRLDGTTGGAERGEVVREFQAEDSSTFVFLLSVRAGGFGLNLQSADTVIMFDSDWNPQVDAQAQARSHRIGQTKDVLVIRLETAGSIEEGVRAVSARKLEIAERAITGGFFDGGQTSEEDRNQFLQSLLRPNDAAGDAAHASVPSSAALNALIARSDAERELFDQEDATRAAAEQRYWQRLLATTTSGSLPAELPPRLAGPTEAAPIINRMNARAAAAAAAAAQTEMLGRGARKRVQLNGYVEIGQRAFNKLCEEGAVGGGALLTPLKPAEPECHADPPASPAAVQVADAAPAADAEPTEPSAGAPTAAEDAAFPTAAPTRKRSQSQAPDEAPTAKRPCRSPSAEPGAAAEVAELPALDAAGPRTFYSWRQVTQRQPNKLRLLKFYLCDSATSSEVLAVTGTEGIGRRFRFAIMPAAAAAEAPGSLRTLGEVSSFLDSLIVAPGGAPDDAEEQPLRVPAASPEAPRVLGRKRGLEAAVDSDDEPPAKRHETMQGPSPPRSSPPLDDAVVSGFAAASPPPPLAAAVFVDKPFASHAEAVGATLVGRRVCRGWRIMLPDGRSSQRWLEGTIVSVLPATGELAISYDDGSKGSMPLHEAKQLIGAFDIEE